jgi:YVTN family beta-propeller protein
VANTDDDTVSRLDAATKTVSQTIQVGGGPAGVAVGGGAVWVTNGLDGTVSRIDPSVNRVVQTIHVGNGPVGVAFGAGKVWVANSVDGTVAAIDPTSGRVTRTLPAVPGATGIVVAFGRVWIVSPSSGDVVSLDPSSGDVVDRVGVGVDPVAVAAGDDALWVANRDDGTVSEIAPQAPAHVTAAVQVGHGPVSIATVKGGVWVANGADGTLMRIDASSDRVIKVVNLANPPQALTGTAAGIYVAVRSSGLEHRGGTLRVQQVAPDFLDPALAYSTGSWAILAMTNDGLVGFRRVGGIEGVQLVPDLAVSLPAATDGGDTYAFRLRPGVRYSTGKLVEPADFRIAIERLFEEKNPAFPLHQYFGEIVGTGRCRPGRACDLSRGIVADDAARTVTFHLTSPDGDFLSELALTFADAVPAGTPPPSAAHDHALPATGPYVVASYHKGRSLTLLRNRYFRQWSADAQPDGYPDRIVVSFPASAASQARSVEDGHADIAPSLVTPSLPKGQLATLATRYPSQLRLAASATTEFFFLNTRVPPFDDVRVRRAVNDALDRRAFTASLGLGYAASCQVLPPNYPSYRRTCPYGSGGPAGLERARHLVRSAGASRARVDVWVPSPAAARGRLMVSVLNSIGLRAQLKPVRVVSDIGAYFGRIFDPRTRAQIGFLNWAADFPSVIGFLPPLFSCTQNNASEFCDRAVDRLFAVAEAAQAQNPGAAPALWQKAERAVLAQAPIVPTDNPENVAFVAKDVGNFQYHPQWGVLLDQLWLK